MIKPPASILAKILCWFFLNLALVAAALVAFFAFQPQVNLLAIIGREGVQSIGSRGHAHRP